MYFKKPLKLKSVDVIVTNDFREALFSKVTSRNKK